MSVNAVAHLNFHGRAREALDFYQTVFGGQVAIATYGDFGQPKEPPDADKVVFGQVAADNGFRVMAYDVAWSARIRVTYDHPGTVDETRERHGADQRTVLPVRPLGNRRGGRSLVGQVVRRWHGHRGFRPRPVGAGLWHADRPLRRHLDP